MQEHESSNPRLKKDSCEAQNARDRRVGTECFLSQIKDIDRRIRRKRSKIERHRDALSLSGVRYSDMPKAPSPPQSSMEEHFCEIGGLEWEITQDMEERSSIQAEMLIRMAEINDTRCFIVLKGLYVDRKGWKAVARELGCGDKGVREAKEAGMDALTRILDTKGELESWIKKAKE